MYGFAHPVVDEYDEMSAPKNVEGRRIPCGASSYAGPFTVKYTEQQDDYNVFRDDVQMYSYWWQKSANYKIQSIYDNGILFICGEAGCFFQ